MDKYINDIKEVLVRYDSSYITIDNELSIKKIHLLLINNNIYEPSNITEINYLGWYYQYTKKDYANMKRYYFMAVNKDDPIAMFNLGLYYQYTEINYAKMKRYYLMAIDKGHSRAMNNFGLHYKHIEKDNDQMKKYIWMAINNGYPNAMCIIIQYYNYNNLFIEKVIDFYQHNIEIMEHHIIKIFTKYKMTYDELMNLIMTVDLRSYKNCPEHIKSMQDNYIQSIKNELNACKKCPKELVNLTTDFIMTSNK